MDARVMPFGKHKGERIDEIPSDYLKWALEELALRDDLTKHIVEILRRRGDDEE